MFNENNSNNSPNSVYSSCFSRSSTPINHESLSAFSSANNTPLPTKDCEIQFGTASAVAPLSDDLANAPSPPTIKLEQSPASSHNDSIRSIWNNKSLSIDISRANSKMAGNNLSRTSGANGQTSFLLDRSNDIWNTTFTPSSQFFGKNITSNNQTVNKNSNLSNADNLTVNNKSNFGYFDKTPMMSSFGNNLEIYPAHSNLVTPRSAVFNSFDAAAVKSNPIVTPTQFGFNNNNSNNMMNSEMMMGNLSNQNNGVTNQVLDYFSKNQNTQINQLSVDDIQNINYEAIFQNNIQLPKFFMPGQQQQAHMDGHYGQDYGMNPLVLVSFKNGRLDIFYYCLNSIPNGLNRGDMVIVEADRGKDLGMVVSTNISIDDSRVLKMMQNQEQNEALKFDGNTNASGNVAATLTAAAAMASSNMMSDNNLQTTHIPKQILRVAMPNEVSQIFNKESDEVKALTIMQSKIGMHQTPMKVLGAEYQWDRRKLTFYYVANKRIDFRDLVKDIFRIYKTRIWMCAVIPTDMSVKNEIEMNDNSMNANINQFNTLANNNGSNYSYANNMKNHTRNNSSISNFVMQQQQMTPLPSFEIQAPTPTKSTFEQEPSLMVPQFNSIWEA